LDTVLTGVGELMFSEESVFGGEFLFCGELLFGGEFLFGGELLFGFPKVNPRTSIITGKLIQYSRTFINL
jgi:hypothetical protein